MNREILLVEIVNKDDMSTEKSRGFSNTKKAEKYFIDILHDWGVTDCDTIEYACDDGFYDEDNRSVIIHEIIFEDDWK